MSVNPIAAVAARIATIEQRFGVSPGASFAAQLDAQRGTSATSGVRSQGGVDVASAGEASSTSPGSGSVAGGWARALPEAGKPWAAAIEAAAAKAGVDPRLLAALTWAESGFKPTARSGAGAVGMTQLMPATARGLGVNPTDPVQNLEGGARYLRQQLDRFGSPQLALAAYNAGPGRVAQAGGVPKIAETQAYVTRVLGQYERLRSAS